jgi:hypothetical protein
MSTWHVVLGLIILGLIGAAALLLWFDSWLRLRRAEFIRTYEWPPGLLDKLSEHYPGLDRKDSALVSRGLRQFFIAYLMSGKRFVSMPSRVADELWHEFILYTREYQRFCRSAFGTFMHHTPATVLGENRKSNAGLRRVWWYCCKYENIDARNPTRLPLLFALDAKLNIPKGFVYHPRCEALREGGSATAHCGGDFSSASFDGGTGGFGNGAGDSSGTGGDGGGSCGGGGGCGGGGD